MLIGNIISNVIYGTRFEDKERFLYISRLITEQVCWLFPLSISPSSFSVQEGPLRSEHSSLHGFSVAGAHPRHRTNADEYCEDEDGQGQFSTPNYKNIQLLGYQVHRRRHAAVLGTVSFPQHIRNENLLHSVTTRTLSQTASCMRIRSSLGGMST